MTDLLLAGILLTLGLVSLLVALVGLASGTTVHREGRVTPGWLARHWADTAPEDREWRR